MAFGVVHVHCHTIPDHLHCFVRKWIGRVLAIVLCVNVKPPPLRPPPLAWQGRAPCFPAWPTIRFPSQQIPEAPIWLLSKNRLADARQSLRRLRGGVSNEAIADEFESLQQSYKQSQHCPSCGQPADQCKHVAPSLWSQFSVVLQMNTLKPLILVVCLFFSMQFSAVFSMRAYMVPVLQAHATIVDAQQFNSFLGVIGIVANVVIVVLIRQMGKRAIYLSSQIGNSVACLLLGECDYGKSAIFGFVRFADRRARHFIADLQCQVCMASSFSRPAGRR